MIKRGIAMPKVAIIGAGISGLAAAIELKRNGISPVVFEEKNKVGPAVSFANVSFKFLFRPICDQIKYLKDTYNLEIKPISDINLLKIQGPNKRFTVSSHLGYSFLRGKDAHSIESHLAAQLAYPIEYDSNVKHEDLLKEFDYLLVADGSGAWSKKLTIWQSTLRAGYEVQLFLDVLTPMKLKCG
nr:FAD-dependent oxidoreductase [Desulforamulus aquiferis]